MTNKPRYQFVTINPLLKVVTLPPLPRECNYYGEGGRFAGPGGHPRKGDPPGGPAISMVCARTLR